VTGQHSIVGPRGDIAFEVWGDGPPLLLLVGLADRFTVVAMENRGMGGSRNGLPFTLEGTADDAALVLDHLALGRGRVLGVSMGGLIACHLAARHPQRVHRLVAASCTSHMTPSVSRVLRFFELVLDRLPLVATGEALMAFAFAAAFADRYPGFVDEAARLWAPDPEDLPGARAQLAHLQEGWDLRPTGAAISCPTLVIAGALDPIMPAITTRELASSIPGAHYREVPGAAHSVLAEGGSGLLGEVVDFLSA
jgi:pimeloyl-ACP methyl ester carboxylesterase